MKPQSHPKVPTPTPETKTVRTRRVEVLVVSNDDGFLIELGPLLGDRYRTRTVEHPDALTPGDSGRWIEIVDAAALADARAVVARMEQQHRSSQIIVIAAHTEEWSAAIARGSIHAVLT